LSRNDKIIRILREKFKIETQVGTYSLRVQPAFQATCSAVGDLTTSRELYERSLTLPLYETLSEEEQAYVVDSLTRASRL
jgi:dTDP-4-amino-4,6-dideoxygalactose transaminase